MSTLPWQAVLIFGFILGAGAMFGILTWFYFNVKGDLDGVADGADGDCEPPVRASDDKTPENGGQER